MPSLQTALPPELANNVIRVNFYRECLRRAKYIGHQRIPEKICCSMLHFGRFGFAQIDWLLSITLLQGKARELRIEGWVMLSFSLGSCGTRSSKGKASRTLTSSGWFRLMLVSLNIHSKLRCSSLLNLICLVRRVSLQCKWIVIPS
ncbi:hypothetical protein NC651_019078 [Populus alba x Populus x berolinensis]|nr:hypothetical protein NC651_019078 [Populus alba x Populus x berolinensis]